MWVDRSPFYSTTLPARVDYPLKKCGFDFTQSVILFSQSIPGFYPSKWGILWVDYFRLQLAKSHLQHNQCMYTLHQLYNIRTSNWFKFLSEVVRPFISYNTIPVIRSDSKLVPFRERLLAIIPLTRLGIKNVWDQIMQEITPVTHLLIPY